ncbi:MAG: hypothetical protein QOH06_1052 [Acidobacteriota bacterium]|nr:hypothetical protein [Acidobacteriota bacterium]
MNASHALTLVQPLIEATQDMKRRKVSKTRCDELLLSINAIPIGAFEGQGVDLERLWMQALSSFRYALLLWLYGDVQAAREESEKANRKIEQIRLQTLGAWSPPAEPARELVAH